MENKTKELRHRIILQPEDEGLLSTEELNAFYAHSLIYPKKETELKINSSISGSTMEPRFSIGNPILRKIASKIIENRVKTYNIKQIAFPGYGGALTSLAWANLETNLNMALIRIDDKSHKRINTKIEGFLSKDFPVWITDDVLTTGNGFIKSFSCLIESGFILGGFAPLMAHEEGAGVRGSQCISISYQEFKFAPIFLLSPLLKNDRPITHFSSKNHILYKN
jgi:orotate phosphoribosyltransferase